MSIMTHCSCLLSIHFYFDLCLCVCVCVYECERVSHRSFFTLSLIVTAIIFHRCKTFAHTIICLNVTMFCLFSIAQTNHWHGLVVWFLCVCVCVCIIVPSSRQHCWFTIFTAAIGLLLLQLHTMFPNTQKFAQGLFCDLAFIPTFNIYTSIYTIHQRAVKLFRVSVMPFCKINSNSGGLALARIGSVRLA